MPGQLNVSSSELSTQFCLPLHSNLPAMHAPYKHRNANGGQLKWGGSSSQFVSFADVIVINGESLTRYPSTQPRFRLTHPGSLLCHCTAGILRCKNHLCTGTLRPHIGGNPSALSHDGQWLDQILRSRKRRSGSIHLHAIIMKGSKRPLTKFEAMTCCGQPQEGKPTTRRDKTHLAFQKRLLVAGETRLLWSSRGSRRDWKLSSVNTQHIKWPVCINTGF